MATITTTIKEPKTFQQIQDQQNELGREKALENLNNNIAKLIKTINKRDEKKVTQEDRLLKQNQLELSKLQLRRAQLGLAKDEKSYSDYSVKYNATHGIGSSIGVSQNSRDNAAAIALSAMTAGGLNPVIIKEILLPPLKMMTRAVTGITKTIFSGISSMGRRISGKTSSAVEYDSESRLHKKLDDIIGAIKTKSKSSNKIEEKKEGFFSKLFGALGGLASTVGSLLWKGLKGALGAYLALKIGEKIGPFIEGVLSNVVGEKAAHSIVGTLQAYGPALIAGYAATGSWRGALMAVGLQLMGEAFGLFTGEASKKYTVIDDGVKEINELLQKAGVTYTVTREQVKGAVGGLILAGPKGMLLGFALGTPAVQEAIQKIKDHNYAEILEDVENKIDTLKHGTPLQSVPSKALEGAILGGVIGSKFGFQGLIIGAILGAAGGFIWDRIKKKKILEDNGIETEWSWSRMNYVVKGTNSTLDDYRNDIIGTGDYDAKTINKMALENIKKDMKSGKIYENSGDSLFGNILDNAKGLAGWAGDKIVEIGKSMYDTAVEWCKSAISTLADIDYGKVFGDIGTFVKDVAVSVFNKAVELAKKGIAWFMGNKEKITETIENLGNSAISFLKNMVMALYNTGVKLGEKAFNWFMENKSDIAEHSLDLGNKAIQVLKDMCIWLYDKAKEWIKKGIEELKDLNPFKEKENLSPAELAEELNFTDGGKLTNGNMFNAFKQAGWIIDPNYFSAGDAYLSDEFKQRLKNKGFTDSELSLFESHIKGEKIKDDEKGELNNLKIKIVNEMKNEEIEKGKTLGKELDDNITSNVDRIIDTLNTLGKEIKDNKTEVTINNSTQDGQSSVGGKVEVF